MQTVKRDEVVNIYLIKSHKILTSADRQDLYLGQDGQDVHDDYFCEVSDTYRLETRPMVSSNGPSSKKPALKSIADGFAAVTHKILIDQDVLTANVPYVYNFSVMLPEEIIYFALFDDSKTIRPGRPSRAEQWEELRLGANSGLRQPGSYMYDLYGLNFGSSSNRNRETERDGSYVPAKDILLGMAPASPTSGFDLQSGLRRPTYTSSSTPNSRSRLGARAKPASQSTPSLSRLRSPPTLNSDRRPIRRPETPAEFFSLEPRTPILDSPQLTRRSSWPPLRVDTLSPAPSVMRIPNFQLQTPGSSVFGDDDDAPLTARPDSPFYPDLPDSERTLPYGITKLVEANTYQTDEYYFTASHQDAAISLVAMAVVTIYDVSKWSAINLDQLIHAGNKLYENTRYVNDWVLGFISLDSVLKKFKFDSKYHEMSVNDKYVHGQLSVNVLQQGIEEFFDMCNCKAGALFIKDWQKYMTIFQEGFTYYMFDSHERNLVGGAFHQYRGNSAVLIGFANTAKMAETIVRNIVVEENVLDFEAFKAYSYSGVNDGFEILSTTRSRLPNRYDIGSVDIGPPSADGGFEINMVNDPWL